MYELFWIILSGVCLIGEIFTVSFLLFFPGIGAILALIASILNLSLTIQVVIFIISTILMILFIRPIVSKFFKTKDTPTNTNALIGKTGVVLKDISADDNVVGQIKVTGEIWSAVCEKGSISKGSNVIVTGIQGVKLIVKENI